VGVCRIGWSLGSILNYQLDDYHQKNISISGVIKSVCFALRQADQFWGFCSLGILFATKIINFLEAIASYYFM
jgi:hypothetical protein